MADPLSLVTLSLAIEILRAIGAGLAAGFGSTELVGSGLVRWIALAGFVHSLGMFGPDAAVLTVVSWASSAAVGVSSLR